MMACQQSGILKVTVVRERCRPGSACVSRPLKHPAGIGLLDLSGPAGERCTPRTCGFSSVITSTSMTHPGRWRVVPGSLPDGSTAAPVTFDVRPFTVTSIRIVYHRPAATFRVTIPTAHQRWKDLFAVQVVPLSRLARPLQMRLYDLTHHVVARGWLGDCRSCATAAGATLTLNVRYHVGGQQRGTVLIRDPVSRYAVIIPVVLTDLPAPTE
jgi:hypothetical protein